MTHDEQFQTLLRLYNASVEHNITLRGKLTISQPDATLKRIRGVLFGGAYKDTRGVTISTNGADRNLLDAIGTLKYQTDIASLEYDADKKPAARLLRHTKGSALLATFNRVHDQLQDVRNILEAEGYE